MNYSEASELLGFTTPKSPEAQARIAKSFLQNCTSKTPLRYKVAANIIIREATQ